MTDKTADVARLMKVTEAVCEELHRQGFSELLADGGFDVAELVRVVIKAADGDVVAFRPRCPE